MREHLRRRVAQTNPGTAFHVDGRAFEGRLKPLSSGLKQGPWKGSDPGSLAPGGEASVVESVQVDEVGNDLAHAAVGLGDIHVADFVFAIAIGRTDAERGVVQAG